MIQPSTVSSALGQFSLKLHHVIFGDLETSLVKMCNCTQRNVSCVLDTLDESDDCKCISKSIQRDLSQNVF